ncbi:MAG: hypothetical protein ACRELA_15535 [Candidatus Rokuibacteriota bacterium]
MRGRRWGVALLGAMLSIQGFAPGDVAWGEERFRAGTKDVSRIHGYSVSYNHLGHTETATGW